MTRARARNEPGLFPTAGFELYRRSSPRCRAAAEQRGRHDAASNRKFRARGGVDGRRTRQEHAGKVFGDLERPTDQRAETREQANEKASKKLASSWGGSGVVGRLATDNTPSRFQWVPLSGADRETDPLCL